MCLGALRFPRLQITRRSEMGAGPGREADLKCLHISKTSTATIMLNTNSLFCISKPCAQSLKVAGCRRPSGKKVVYLLNFSALDVKQWQLVLWMCSLKNEKTQHQHKERFTIGFRLCAEPSVASSHQQRHITNTPACSCSSICTKRCPQVETPCSRRCQQHS